MINNLKTNDNSSPNENPFIVTIAASADGLETLKIFFMHTKLNKSIAFVIITHLSPDHISFLPEILQQCTPIKVLPITNEQKIEANHIYVLPPGNNVTIHEGVLTLGEKKSNADAMLSIDYFICSLAKDQGRKVVFIILLGMSNDGTVGLRALRKQGNKFKWPSISRPW